MLRPHAQSLCARRAARHRPCRARGARRAGARASTTSSCSSPTRRWCGPRPSRAARDARRPAPASPCSASRPPIRPATAGCSRDDGGALLAIREHKDASEAERAITLLQCRADGARRAHRRSTARRASATTMPRGEFYLTDVVEIARADGACASPWSIAPEDEVQGVNDRVQLARPRPSCRPRLRRAAMEDGATLIAPDTVFFSHDTKLGRDVLIEPHVVFGPGVTVADDAVIHAFSHLEGATIGRRRHRRPLSRGCARREARRAGAKVGNFVEIKNAEIGEGAKVNHLTYIGDAERRRARQYRRRHHHLQLRRLPASTAPTSAPTPSSAPTRSLVAPVNDRRRRLCRLGLGRHQGRCRRRARRRAR